MQSILIVINDAPYGSERPFNALRLAIKLNEQEFALAQGSEIKMCKTCIQARGLSDIALVEGCSVATLDDLAQWTLEADKVFTF